MTALAIAISAVSWSSSGRGAGAAIHRVAAEDPDTGAKLTPTQGYHVFADMSRNLLSVSRRSMLEYPLN